ncbi:MAG: DUF3094 family protein [Pseudomonadota bacterium]
MSGREQGNTEQTPAKLSEEDLARVRHVTTTGVHSVERKPFRLWLLLAYIVGFIIFLGQLSIWMADIYIN